VSPPILLRGLGGPPGSRLAELLGEGLESFADLRGVGGGFERVVAEVAAAGAGVEEIGADLPAGAALAEAVALRLRARGVALRWGDPVVLPDAEALLELCHRRGRHSVELIEADSTLLPGLQIGSWFDCSWRTRLRSRRARRPSRSRAERSAPALMAAADRAFWAGVRDGAGPERWRWLTSTSYVALVYHRFSGDLKPGQERIDIAPERFGRQLRALRLLGFRPLGAEELLEFHTGSSRRLPARAVAITVDDAMADCIGPLRDHAGWLPQLFVPTAELGGAAHWIDGEAVASWDEIGGLEAAGVGIGSHGRHHRRLSELDAAAREEELSGSLAELRQRLAAPLPIVAYPNGDHDERVCEAARQAGYEVAYTTAKGRNGAGTPPYALKRVSVHGADGVAAILWKVVTGEDLPQPWLRLRARLGKLRPGRRRG
jgi:peptidoglycan/xylan/chitin deacetylase (PgdA/CDA1 family)